MSRIYNKKINVDSQKIKEFYKDRFQKKTDIDIDAPVVLCCDRDKNKIQEWNDFELKERIPLLELDKESKVLELGFGTGRVAKFIIDENPKAYLGVDYVREFVDLAKNRDDIKKSDTINFMHKSFKDLVDDLSTDMNKYNRFVVSGGVFMYINDEELIYCLDKLVNLLDEKCIIYISEPVALKERLTLNEFYSESLENNYSAIYRTIDGYINIFDIFKKAGFKLEISEEFFYDDIKEQKETKQWLFMLKR